MPPSKHGLIYLSNQPSNPHPKCPLSISALIWRRNEWSPIFKFLSLNKSQIHSISIKSNLLLKSKFPSSPPKLLAGFNCHQRLIQSRKPARVWTLVSPGRARSELKSILLRPMSRHMLLCFRLAWLRCGFCSADDSRTRWSAHVRSLVDHISCLGYGNMHASLNILWSKCEYVRFR